MNESEEILFTSGAILDLLSQIDELKNVDVGVTDSGNGTIQISVGDSVYNVSTNNAVDVSVDDETLGIVEDANVDAFDGIQEDNLELEISDEYPYDAIEGGVFKEVAKTLLIGGMIRLTNKLLRK